jgi:uncharacterized damage-inducible protein DinB
MIHTISDFEHIWSSELESTQKILKHLTNASLSQPVGHDFRTLGRIAWHITTTIPEMMNRTGLKITDPDPEAPVPGTAREIFNAYNNAAIALLEQIKASWTDETLEVVDEMYGERWKRGDTLQGLIFHQIHHRGQMTVLMRQAGLQVPGIFGPSRDEWAQWGMKPPDV